MKISDFACDFSKKQLRESLPIFIRIFSIKKPQRYSPSVRWETNLVWRTCKTTPWPNELSSSTYFIQMIFTLLLARVLTFHLSCSSICYNLVFGITMNYAQLFTVNQKINPVPVYNSVLGIPITFSTTSSAIAYVYLLPLPFLWLKIKCFFFWKSWPPNINHLRFGRLRWYIPGFYRKKM